MKSIKNGSWHDPAVWDLLRVPAESDDIILEHDLTSDNKSIIIRNRLYSRKGSLKFINVKESTFIGTIDDKSDPRFPTDPDGIMTSDIGLWVVGSGVLDIEGTPVKAWTTANGSLLKGATQFSVQDATGWAVGQEIVIVPQDTPGLFTLDWDDATNTPKDSFLPQFERRIIKSISGNTVTIDPLLYDHLAVTIQGESWFTTKILTAAIVNNTRSVKITGTATSRPHVYIKSSKPQNIKYVEFSYLGPRKGGTRPDLHLGRYALHFHHCGNGSRGTRIVGCAIHDLGSRAIVPHGSHGISIIDNAVVFFMNDCYWYDPQHVTHDLLYDGNFAGGVVNGSAGYNTMGFQFGQGDGNVARRNRAAYCKGGEIGTGGQFVWTADNENVWVFENNLGHSSTCDFFNWQNSPHNHFIELHTSYNCIEAGHNGAYINSYNFRKCIFYNAKWVQKATPGNNAPMFDLCVFDGANKIPHVVEVTGSPVTAGVPNSFVRCVFRDYTDTAFLMNTFFIQDADAKKAVDIVLCKFTGPMVKFSPGSIYDSYFRIQPITGQSVRVTQQGTTNINPFAPVHYGDGSGLNAEYYNGSNFESLAFKRLDNMLKFQQWSIDKASSPTGVHYLITGDAYSIRWTGFIESQYTEPVQMVAQSDGGVRIWIDNKLVLDRWAESSGLIPVLSSPVPMVAKQKYAIKIEHMNTGGARALILSWTSPGMGETRIVPIGQLYPSGAITPPPPPEFFNTAISKSYTRNNCGIGFTGSAVVVNVPANKYKSLISLADANLQAENFAQSEANKLGTCTAIIIPPVDPCTAFNAQDYLDLQPDVKAAGYTTQTAINHYNTYGIKEKRRANKLCLDPNLKPAIVPIPVVEIFKSVSGKEYTLETNGTLKIKT